MAQAKILWIDLQPSLYCLNQRVAQLLSRSFLVQRWSFQHDLDESCSVGTIHDLLKQTLVEAPEPVHLIGHGMSGTIACLFAEKYPELVKSLTMLSVDTLSTNHWSSHYLQMRTQLSCSRATILNHLSSLLFPRSNPGAKAAFQHLLAKCLDNEFIQGSIVDHESLGVLSTPEMPVLVLNGDSDFVVDNNSRDRWSKTLKSGDRYQAISEGSHFFHFNQSRQVAKAIVSFVQMVPVSTFDRELNLNDFTYLSKG